jgi:hypothetical protein
MPHEQRLCHPGNAHQQTSLWGAQYALIADTVIGMGDRRMLIASLSQAWSTS